MAKNTTLHSAKNAKNDEFYTRLDDIEAEISSHPDYKRQFQGKVVFCNCDDPEWSNFYMFFRLHFKRLGLKKLITTHYNADGSPSYKLEWDGSKLGDDTVNMVRTPLQGNGDFRSEECIEILKEADIVVTNPPFSLFREYIAQLVEYDKKFVVLGNPNAITYKEIFPLLKDNKMFIGYKSMGSDMYFIVSDEHKKNLLATKKEGSGYRIINGEVFGRCPAIWYTNLDLDKHHKPKDLTRLYTGREECYPKYDNYDAIEVSKVDDIPKDYFGVMGVPITFLGQYCSEQFEIIGLDRYTVPKEYLVGGRVAIDGKPRYARILIQRKVQVSTDESTDL